jgi:hypothetical protein
VGWLTENQQKRRKIDHHRQSLADVNAQTIIDHSTKEDRTPIPIRRWRLLFEKSSMFKSDKLSAAQIRIFRMSDKLETFLHHSPMNPFPRQTSEFV